MTTSTAVKVDELKSLRANNKGSITRILNHINKNSASFYQISIEKAIPDDAGQTDIDELYISAKRTILELIHEQKDPAAHELSTVGLPSISHRLPQVNLPKFDGKYAEYKNFISTFRSLVHSNPNLSVIERFNHLLSCLSGEALNAVKTFQVSRENYQKALDRLKERYDNDNLIFLENISSIFDVERASKAESQQLRRISDTISALYNSLLSLGTHEAICDAIMIHVALSKVDSSTKQRWNDSVDFSKLPKWSDCCSMIDRRCQQLDAQSRSNIKPQESSSKSKTNRYTLATSTASEKVCSYCTKSGHRLFACQQFLDLSIEQRFNYVKQHHWCLNCLGKGHVMTQCPSKGVCKECKSRHHSLLHRPQGPPAMANNASSVGTAQAEPPLPSSTSIQTTLKCQESSAESQIILATAVVLIKNRKGEFEVARALLDSGSQVNFISETLAKSLKLSKAKTSTQILGIGSMAINVQYATQTTVRSRVNSYEVTLEFLVSNKITGCHPACDLSTKQIEVPDNIDLADPAFYRPQKIDVLLGAEVFFQLLSVGQIRLGSGDPILQKTLFGWIISGRCHPRTALVTSSHSEDLLEGCSLEKFWDLEAVESKRQVKSLEQQRCEAHYMDNTHRNQEGRIVVRLPFKVDPVKLGNSYDIAHRRFIQLERRLQRNLALKESYTNFMTEYEELNHMSGCENVDLSIPHFFIPHHCVIKPDSETTKLRVVFDASCRSSTQVSLNETLLVGPTIQNELFIILFRFRCHQYGLTADIIKMYRQVLLHQDDRNFQLILWRKEPSLPLKTYKLNTVTYGTASAPFLAIKSLQYAAEHFDGHCKLGRAAILNDFYVDDMLTGSDDVIELQALQREVCEILSNCQFTLAKWHCNYKPMHMSGTDKEITIDEDVASALGTSWHPSTDELSFSFKPKNRPRVISKRSILSLTSSLFDPLGLLSPLIIPAKVILQRLWMYKCAWDESVSQDIATAWLKIVADLDQIRLIRIPRFSRIPDCAQTQVHGFADASIKAYGCCLYFRCVDSCGRISVHLVASKSRVAPVRVQSLPRLELCAAHLLTKLWVKLSPHLPFKAHQVHFWSDSQIVLHWIQTHSSLLSTFVGNRIAEIQELTQDIRWHHVRSENNPADLISRGCTVNELRTSQWFEGPKFLRDAVDFWPPEKALKISDVELKLERRKSALIVEDRPIPSLLQVVYKFSNHLKCLRVMSYVIRFVKRTPSASNVITSSELQHTLRIIVSAIQHHYFNEQINAIQKQRIVKGAFASLSPFLDTQNDLVLLRVGGRLQNATIPESAKNPLLLPKDDVFVKRFIEHLHRTNYHAGPKALTALIQEQFWIVNCRSLAKQIVSNCIICARYRPKLLTQIMGQLPKDRVTANRPFEVCGVDFAGPITTYYGIRGKPPFKSYIAVFVCFVSKAVHLDTVPNLSTTAFINVLKRFIGRRGLPSKIYCDNATNFVGADRKLKELHQEFFAPTNLNSIHSFCTASRIDFCFIPPRAPHFGGLWEAAVKTAKSLLYRTLFNVHLTLEDLQTALVEIEAVMNSRPISAMSTSPDDFQALTPGHFVIGQSLRSLPQPLKLQVGGSHLERFHHIATLKAHFWKRWHKEYLLDMQNRYRWTSPQRSIQVNDLVVIHDDNLPTMTWPLGRVIRVFPGKDGHVRVAELKTATTTLRRPITKLAILPLN